MFHPLCYDHGKKLFDENEGSDYEKMIRIQINEFGQVPKQLFKEPHPIKFSNEIRELNPIIINDEINDEEEEKEEIETIITYPIYSKLKYNYNKNFLKVSNFHKKYNIIFINLN